jgi:hypothetical protein
VEKIDVCEILMRGECGKMSVCKKKCSVVRGFVGWSGKTVAKGLIEEKNFSENLSCESIKTSGISFINA